MVISAIASSACERRPAKSGKRTRSHTTAAIPKKPDIVVLSAASEPQIDTLVVKSKMGRPVRNLVVRPSDYSEGICDYPVLYILHGYDGAYTDWSKKTDLKKLADEHRIIIVCPDGQDSWYFDSPIDPKMQFETYIIAELIPAVDNKYNTIAERDARAITGLSMGGHGALWLAWRHTDTFAACGSMSGGVDITKFPGKWKIHLRLGNYDTNKEVWKSHSVASLVPSLQNKVQAIIIDDGDKDIFYDVNVELHKALKKQGIDHNFDIRPGNHSWTFWITSLPLHMKFFDKHLTPARTRQKIAA